MMISFNKFGRVGLKYFRDLFHPLSHLPKYLEKNKSEIFCVNYTTPKIQQAMQINETKWKYLKFGYTVLIVCDRMAISNLNLFEHD